MTQRPRTSTEAAQYALPLLEPSQLDLFGFATARALGAVKQRVAEAPVFETAAAKPSEPAPLFELCNDPWSVAHFIDGVPYSEAKRVMAAWQDWPRPAMALTGPPFAGKTHLAHIWVHDLEGQFVSAEALAAMAPEAAAALAARALVVDDADKGLASLQLFSIFNALREGGGPILFLGRGPPASWATESTDLASRFKGLTSVRIGEPDDVVLARILQSLCRKKFIRLGDSLALSLISRSVQSFEALGGLADGVERLAEVDALEPSARVLERILTYARGANARAMDGDELGNE